SRDDGLVLRDAWVTLSARCAPPGNAPRPDELLRCSPWLARELELLRPQVVLALGAIAWAAVLRVFRTWGVAVPRPAPRFAHGAEVSLPGAPWLLGAYHVSQQNTQTGRLTPAMFDAVLRRALELRRCAAGRRCSGARNGTRIEPRRGTFQPVNASGGTPCHSGSWVSRRPCAVRCTGCRRRSWPSREWR